jgi:AcrR family transcriptional regulator
VVAAARRLFAEQGYAATGTTAIVTAAGVGTRGALYHHFEDKEALFAEVFAEISAELAEEIARRADLDHVDPLEALRRRLVTFLQCIAENREAQRLLLDGPVVLGWQRFRALETAHGLRGIESTLARAAELGIIGTPPATLGSLVLAVVDEAAMTVATAEAPEAVCTDAGEAVSRLLWGLRIDRGSGADAGSPELLRGRI